MKYLLDSCYLHDMGVEKMQKVEKSDTINRREVRKVKMKIKIPLFYTW